MIRSGLAASASCGNPPTRYRVFAASVVCFAVPYTVRIAGSLLRAERRTIAGGLLFPNIPTAPGLQNADQFLGQCFDADLPMEAPWILTH